MGGNKHGLSLKIAVLQRLGIVLGLSLKLWLGQQLRPSSVLW
jgi:hypothetical protein